MGERYVRIVDERKPIACDFTDTRVGNEFVNFWLKCEFSDNERAYSQRILLRALGRLRDTGFHFECSHGYGKDICELGVAFSHIWPQTQSFDNFKRLFDVVQLQPGWYLSCFISCMKHGFTRSLWTSRSSRFSSFL